MNVRFIKTLILLLFLQTAKPITVNAWGPDGHAIVGRIAMQYVTPEVRQNILALLGTMPIDTAANWMDIMKSNADYEFMRPWHYVNFPQEQQYIITNTDNSINRLFWTFNELKNKKVLCTEQIRFDLYVMLHLMGDLHMPLHNGFAEDVGGNKIMVQYDSIKNHNLHWFWDEDIIRLTRITDQDCLQHFKQSFLDSLTEVDITAWMYESRSLLPQVYDFPGFELSPQYLAMHKVTVEKQLLKAGLRLAFILNKLFTSPAPEINLDELVKKYKNGIRSADAPNKIGKNVTICDRVYSVRYTPNITQISIGAKFPNNPVTIVIFAKNYEKFKLPLDELFKDKNICVKGTLEEFRGKLQIIVEDPEDIIIQ
jgi:hypothetical protein